MHIFEIKATDKIQECWALLEEHREELTTDKSLMVLKPDIDTYKMLEAKEILFTLALYDGKDIVGYSVNILHKNMHYSDLIISQNDVLFVTAKYRNSKWGLKLISETEKIAKERGATMVLFHGKPYTAFSSLMPRIGYKIQDIMFSKVL